MRDAGNRATVTLTVSLVAAPLVVIGLLLAGRALASEQQQSADVEVQLGQEVFDELKAKGMMAEVCLHGLRADPRRIAAALSDALPQLPEPASRRAGRGRAFRAGH